MTKKLFALAFLMMAISSQSYAAENPAASDNNPTLKLDADRTTTDDNGVFHAEGQVKITIGDVEIHMDKATVTEKHGKTIVDGTTKSLTEATPLRLSPQK